ncbi:MFS domain-containing protein [Mycena kentingensis (nom. inval.)]|nr:MFS domain-containing protein [Mycena kentingensis (nom. inval.)]
MASRIPIRRGPRTVGAENDQPTIRAKAAPARNGLAPAKPKAAPTAPVAYTKPKASTTTDAPGSAKRKREALREVTDRNRARVAASGTASTVGQKPPSTDGRKILGLPKKSVSTSSSSATRIIAKENAKPPAVAAAKALATVVERIEIDEEEGPSPKRQRTSSVGPDEAEVARIAIDVESDEEEEADPDGDDWEDLDAADADDPVMASEYVAEIQDYLREIEKTTMPNAKYMSSQPELNWTMRGLLIEWLIQVHTRFSLLPETLFLCVNLIDRFLTARTVSTNKVQLVGMACLLIAAKYEETVAPAIENYVFIADGATTADEMRTAEQHILRSLEWDLRYPNPMHYLRRISKADGYSPNTRTLGKYLAEISCVDHRLIGVPPSMLSAAAMWLARLALGQTAWTPTLAHYAGYRESALVPVANVMLRYLVQPIKHESFYKKYAGKRNMKVSVFMRQWVLGRWTEGAKIELTADLGALKREARNTQAAAGQGADDGDEPEAEAV